MKKLPNSIGDWGRKTYNCWGRDINGMVINEKSLDLGKVLRKKPTLYDWSLKKKIKKLS